MQPEDIKPVQPTTPTLENPTPIQAEPKKEKPSAYILLNEFLTKNKIAITVGPMRTKLIEDGSMIIEKPSQLIVKYMS